MITSDDSLRMIVAHLAHLRAEHPEVMRDPDLVEPTGEYFPDEFAVEPKSIERLMRRMMTYAPLASDLEVGLAFVEAEGDAGCGSGGCGTGACGTTGPAKARARGGAAETDDGYVVFVNVADTGEPKLLTSSLARSIGRVVLFEAGEEVDPRGEDALAELTAVAAGLGVLVLNGASVYKKGCGGIRDYKGTALGVDDLALAVALFVRATGKKPQTVRRHLEITQREAFDEALAWLSGQPKLVRALAETPEMLADGVFALEAKKGLLGRWLSRRQDDPGPGFEPAPRKATARSEAELRRLAEVKALVDEALQDP